MTWPSVQLRRVAHFDYGDSLADEIRQDGSVLVYGSNGPVGFHNSANTGGPAIVIGRKGSFGKVQYSEAPVFAIDTTFFVDGNRSSADLRWFYYVLGTLGLDSLSEDVGVPGLSRDRAYDQRLPLPPLAAQRAIANYLDTETARIDALIEKKRRMVELLEERHGAFRIRTVLGEAGSRTGKLSPSGLYGYIPSGWAETPLRHLRCEVQTGPFGSQLHAEDYVEGGWPVVNPMNLKDGLIIPRSDMTVTEAKKTELSRHALCPGDIVFGRRGEMGRVGLVGPVEAGWLCGTGSLRLRLVGEYLDPAYLKLLLGTPPAKAYFELASVGSTMDNLNSEIVLDFPTLVPPMDRQRQIVADVMAMERTVLNLRTKSQDQINLLVERRQALITAAVTGELDIPGVAA